MRKLTLNEIITNGIKFFDQFELETSSFCNRTCSTCLRNSIPDRAAVSDWFNQTFLPLDTIHGLFEQLLDMGFDGHVCLQHYNEPLLDPRIIDIGRYVKGLRKFKSVYICTNADYINEGNAAELDGVFDVMNVSLYMDAEMQAIRMKYLNGLFSKTSLYYTQGIHIPTHNSPKFDVVQLSGRYIDHPCYEPPRRLIINHKGECLLCCTDMIGHFGLGNIKDYTLEELWFSDKHQQIIKDLQSAGGRRKYPHCVTCPQPCWSMIEGTLQPVLSTSVR